MPQAVSLGWRARRRGSFRQGFTLLEILLVIVLFSLLGSIMVGGAISLFKSVEEHDPEAIVLSMLQKVRGEAVEKGTVIELTPLPEDAGFLWGADGVENLPKREGMSVRLLRPEISGATLIGGQLEERSIERVRFYPDGSCDPMRIQVRRGENRRVYSIDPWTAAPLPEGGKSP